MISFSLNVRNLLQQPTIETFYMIDFDGYRTTNYFAPITLSNGEVYNNDGRLYEVDPPQLSTTVDRELYKISFADPDFYFGTLIDQGIVGAPVTVRIGFVDPLTKQPLTAVSDTVVSYKGRVDNGAYSIKTEDVGEALFVLTCASPMANLDAIRSLSTTKDALKTISPSDTSFDQIYEGSGQVELKWGKG
jgi:hypothetical protein